ncbi:MAG: GNAT family N-acetyltransferase [Chloroflexota bacterium]|nr:GNAT family N-acetyltransferase [Chloroflexota bacterium]
MTTIRSFQSDDIPAYVHLISELQPVDQLGAATSEEQTRRLLGRPRCHPEQDIFVADERGRLTGYIEVHRELEIGRLVLTGGVHPACRRRGLGSRLLEAGLKCGSDLGAKRAHVPVAESETGSQGFLENRGFTLVRRQYQMGLTECGNLPPQMPAGYVVDHFARGDEESLCAIQNLAFAEHWGFCPNTVEEVRYMVNVVCPPAEGVLFISSDRKKKAGYCWTAAHPTDSRKGLVHMMGVAPDCRGMGLGRAVLLAGIEYLRSRGIDEIGLTVDCENRAALALYQSAGFTRTATTLWYERGLDAQ